MTAVVDLGAADDRVFDGLRGAFDTDIDAGVHTTRKGLKRLRSHLRLRKTKLAPEVFADENAELRSIGRVLAPARDAYVLGQTLAGLEATRGWEPAAERIAAHHCETMAALRDGPLQDVRERIERARKRWPKTTGLDPGTVADAIADSYGRGAEVRALAATSGRAGAFHDWRKRVKTLRYQLEAVGAREEIVEELTDLGEWLGEEHDHTVFIDFCDERLDLLPDRRDRYVLIDRAEVRRDHLRTRALESTIYDDDPDQFVVTALAGSRTR